ncbi:uncharacterized protein LOC133818187 isoform X2 [Humulus lupulus]|uniref:uncharacterized protein LOC133818187 isoform X2 n=1 Tax=Humulus lupulus TaxID=3486 RepID=UPI002B40D668|nr:uncharacterized protein LOC133818187 isoform X2 [Humulus lupulus]
MAYSTSRIFLYPLKQSLAAMTSSSSFTSPPRQFLYTKWEPLKRLMKGFEPVLRSRVSGFQCILNTQRKSFQNFYIPGSKIRFRSAIAVSTVLGLVGFAPHVSYAMDDFDNLVYEHHQESWGASGVEEDSNAFWTFAKRFWLPVFFLVTVISHLDDPVMLIAFKVLLFLFSTKPSPFSVYVFVDESVYAHKVEVQDYKLLCLARVEVRDQKFSLVGILGGWWSLPSPSQGAYSILRLIQKLKVQQLELSV